MELDANPNPLREALVAQPLEVVDGHLDLPAGPGLGIELNRATVDRYQVPLSH